ncbi:Replication protein A subunit [Merluccius polli]|uniref:Replication protein A subunit n=1 Tax=Merluccius polli TaxID=89951 RepID=A0AA47MTE9_MERPO|nr:Replication protein A subunit [Merluccius polli]
MWDPRGCGLSQAHHGGAQEARITRATLQILPCTVSQLLSGAEVGDSYVIGGREVNQASIVGVVRRCVPFDNHVQYRVDDMTGPPVDVKLWVNTEAVDPVLLCNAGGPGTYVKVLVNVRRSQGQGSLVANSIRRLEDLNEVTSHMLEVVQAHMLPSERADGTPLKAVANEIASYGLSTVQSQVLNVISNCPCKEGISFDGIKRKLDYLSFSTIRRSLEALIKGGNVFMTIDEDHFKSI